MFSIKSRLWLPKNSGVNDVIPLFGPSPLPEKYASGELPESDPKACGRAEPSEYPYSPPLSPMVMVLSDAVDPCVISSCVRYSTSSS